MENSYLRGFTRRFKERAIAGVIICTILGILLIILGGCSDSNLENFISVESINYKSGTELTGSEIIKVDVDYNIASDEVEKEGFYIMMWFENEEGEAFGMNGSRYELTKRSGSVTLSGRCNTAFFYADKEIEVYLELTRFGEENKFSVLAQTERYYYTLKRE